MTKYNLKKTLTCNEVRLNRTLKNVRNFVNCFSSDTEVHRCTVASSGGRVTNAVGTIFRKVFVGTRARPI